MKNSTNKTISKLLCVAMLASMVGEAPLMAATSDSIAVNVGGNTVNVTPGQWVTVNNGGTTAQYNVRYVNGKAVALDVNQYTSLVFGEGTTAATTAAANIQAADTAAVAQAAAVDASAASGAKVTTSNSTGSWIKNELAEYGNNIKNSFNAGKENGNAFGTKTVETVKTGAAKVGETVKNGASAVGETVSNGASKVGNFFKNIGSKAGSLLKSAKDKVTGLFKKNDTASASGSKTEAAAENTQSNEQTSQASEQASQSNEQTAQANEQAAQSNEQTAQANEQAAQTTEQAAQVTEQAAQTTEQAAQAEPAEKQGMFSKLKDKAVSGLKSGYETGKAMTKQGVQNVKDSLKSGFSAKNILVTAGITVATDLATQIMRGEDVSLKKAVKTVCCAEFAGSVVGSVTGAAAGSFFTPFLSAVPVVGGALSALAPVFGSVVGSSVGAYLAGDIKNGHFSIKNAFAAIDWAGVVGQSIGSTAGAALGSCLGPVGTVIGGIVGGYVGNWAAQKLKSWFGKDSYSSIGMPVGTTTMGSVVAGEVTIGSVATENTVEIPVANSAEVPVSEITVSASAETMGSYASEIQLANAKYQELYKLYNEMLSQGRQEDAIKVAQEMNRAKSDYEALVKGQNK